MRFVDRYLRDLRIQVGQQAEDPVSCRGGIRNRSEAVEAEHLKLPYVHSLLFIAQLRPRVA
eukprot:scaffold8589_cov267-Pinguiococcus_pyrenoidosus.AAC.2